MGVKVIGLGAGGHAKVLIEILHTQDNYDLIGLLDVNQGLHGQQILGVPVLGGDDLLIELQRQGVKHFFVGVGSSRSNKPRQRLYDMALQLEMESVKLVHPRATVSPSVVLGEGVVIMAGAVINACSRLGINVIVNTNAVVEHDCIIGDHVHIASGARMAGEVEIKNGAHIGLGASILQGVCIGQNAVVGAGSVVLNDVDNDITVVGVPARPLEKN
jgi:UDP-perosamine 4-acetyltransferase